MLIAFENNIRLDMLVCLRSSYRSPFPPSPILAVACDVFDFWLLWLLDCWTAPRLERCRTGFILWIALTSATTSLNIETRNAPGNCHWYATLATVPPFYLIASLYSADLLSAFAFAIAFSILISISPLRDLSPPPPLLSYCSSPTSPFFMILLLALQALR